MPVLPTTIMMTEFLAENLLNTSYEKLPEEVLDKAKLCFIDFLAVALRGSRSRSGKIVKELFKDGEESSVIGYKHAKNTDAPLINGVFAHSLDLDDGHRFAHLHPGSSVIPAALALSESFDKNGKEFLCAVVAGYQVAIQLGKISNPEHRNKGFHSSGTCGTFGAAAAASKVLGLEFEDTLNALGIAGTQAAGLLESDHSGSMGKHLHAGKASQSGVLAALLAKNGFTGASSILDGSEGFLNAMVYPSSKQDDDINNILEDGRYHILDVYFKKYPVCRHLHSSVDAAIDVHRKLSKNGVNPDNIQSMTVKTYKIAYDHSDFHPSNIESIRQSLPVSVVISILKGDLNPSNLKIDDKTSDLLKKTDLLIDEEMEDNYPYKRQSEVSVMADDVYYIGKFDLPRGEPENQFKKSEILNKFHDLNPLVDIEVLDIVDGLESYMMKDVMLELNSKFII